MEGNNFQFKLLSLNVRGIRSFEKKRMCFQLVAQAKCRHLFSAGNVQYKRDRKSVAETMERRVVFLSRYIAQ